jgi:hypothetical protein
VDHRGEQTLIGVDREAQVLGVVVGDLLGFLVVAGVDVRVRLERVVRFTPSRSANVALALARSATILVMSTSWVCVNCAVACRDSRVFFAVI